MKPYVITVCHQKGGVAKTTTASALGAVLAESNYPTLLIDLDPSANLTAGLGISPREVKKSAADFLLGNDYLTKIYQSTGVSGLDIIPSGADMSAASQVLAIRPSYETILMRSLNGKSLPHDFVIIDCPPAMAAITTAALTAADLAIIPNQCEYFALQAINSIFGYVRQVRQEHNPILSYRLLVTMFDRRGKLHTNLYDKLVVHYGDALFKTVIGFDSKLRASQIAGQPITVFAPRTRAARQYRKLAEEMYAYVQEQRVPQPN
jgi:chromosome partitioning protein